MEPWVLTILTVILATVMAVESYKLNCLTKSGAVASFIVGTCVGVFGSFNAFFLLTAFTIAGFIATLRDFDRKKAMGLQEGELGERTAANVFGVGLPPCLVVLINFIHPLDPYLFDILFISTITVAGADTIASEMGVKAKKTYMITTFKEVPAGVNGGVSVRGTLVSTIVALLIAMLGWFVLTGTLNVLLLIPFAAGVLGNILDSVFGAVLENPGYISKYTNNCSTAIIGSVVGGIAYLTI